MYKKGLVFILALGMAMNVTACGGGNKEVQTTAQTESSTEEATTKETPAKTVTTSESVSKATTEKVSEATEQSEYDVSYKEAERLLISTLGLKNEETGKVYSYTYLDKYVFEEVEYYVFHWGQVVDGHVIAIGQLFVSADCTKIYSGIYTGDKNVIYTDKNYLE